MAEPDIHVPDFGLFDSAASNAETVAAQAREHANSLRSAITSAASGIEGMKTGAALHHLAGRLEAEVNQWASSIEHIAPIVRDVGKNYSNTDDNAASGFKAKRQ